ncbi:MFS transporter [Acinetobacter sp. ANC 4558]|uniref:MFS transporter n=1 Tax=Acinetobacter sp. ANC 4558 TaxID=1977876 RepID=UPI000B6C2748|nr:MFS transporter [Acinetobacter sp. ANC 4558]OTG86320.1 MFS transporter [Acinetobacter sp. ANC 4558]
MIKRDNSLITKRIRLARLATFGGFMLIGAMIYVWSTSVSAYRKYLGLEGALGDASFGLIALGIGIGSAAGALVIGKFIDLFGAKSVVGCTLILYPVSIIVMGYIPEFWFAFAIGVVMGLLRGATDSALNAHGVQVERFYKRPIMSGFHACYPLGGFIFGMLGSYFAGISPDSATLPFTILGGTLLIISFILSRFLLDKHEIVEEDWQEQHTDKAVSHAPNYTNRYIIILMIGYGVLLLASMFGENAVGDWGQEYMHRTLGTTTAVAAMAISFFSGAQFLGRLFGDRLTERYGAPRIVFYSGILAIAGLLLQTFGGSVTIVFVGYSLFGLGLSCLAPIMLSSAGRKDPKNAGRNISIVNGLGYSGMLLAPAILSTIVSTFGIERLLYFPIALMIIFVIIAPAIMRDKKDNNKPIKVAI